ncbi:MAG: putative addiction module antidote protein [Candidatus Margulisbacteria bacterium]|jgi:probable addiction module antidote protein|nr:putative addiction module antidote protein [Candidatus Margulisiibacteriota bacterium]
MVKFYDYDVADYIKTEKDIRLYIEAAFEDGDPGIIASALGDVARIRGMAKIAQKAGVNRESLYRSLSKTGVPNFKTITSVINSLGFKLAVLPQGRRVAV